ncbi:MULTISPECIES: TetR/AcrR family transcriptional regulator [unclassified Streptomyces]|uniref:TetR/AcrR family transcriptional regulator n=1 Tax=unclassified Streptomyces TaxID=2593676 RepID=UPI00081E9FB2|nr:MULTISPECIES: TetR/AcrR family transcriptional regulator [unclassified Streptomyces]MYR26941.1 TetR family transcriptional regulator [Streptomyces sp. SID4945]SCD28347.1 transcriptional regulator, TetR family [Streptomyces sp. TverLS-915]SCF14527.1 transcriptional regulator, TetR family [Streptomyces sp. LcepLS]
MTETPARPATGRTPTARSAPARPAPGRRERKKAATRQSIADAALRLFLERGYEHVSVRDVAEEADVSPTTVFKHFPGGKEALVFDQEEHTDASLVAAVRERDEGEAVVDALHRYVRERWLPHTSHPQHAEFHELIDSTPALRAYSERMWVRHTDTLSAALAEEFGVPAGDLACDALARFVLEVPVLARGRADQGAAVDALFGMLREGWRAPEGAR